jgi:glycosyltransferase involved in cell wall biosynthesis
MAEIVDDGRTGYHVEPARPAALARAVERARAHPQELAGIGREVRAEFERLYTAERSYDRLMQIYQRALGGSDAAL